MEQVTCKSPSPKTRRPATLVGDWLNSWRTTHRPTTPVTSPDATRTRLGEPHTKALAITHPGTVVERAPKPISAAAPGRCLGPYRLVERIGRGRQADVWRARRLEAPCDEVAIKLLVGTIATRDPRRLAQLRREAERGTRLASPFLLPTFDYGEDDGLAYLAMPLVEGCPLGQVIEQRRMVAKGGEPRGLTHPLVNAEPTAYVAMVVALLAKVARAVAVAHDARVVHRDIKPMNILVGRRAEQETSDDPGVYLCDFGLARDLDFATPHQLRDGAGSPLYMAPERLLKHPADEVRCDVYALGVTLFESLALIPPFDVPPDLPPGQWAAFLARAKPPRLQAFGSNVPRALQAVVQRAMERDPARRHATAHRLADDLERSLQGLPTALALETP